MDINQSVVGFVLAGLVCVWAWRLLRGRRRRDFSLARASMPTRSWTGANFTLLLGILALAQLAPDFVRLFRTAAGTGLAVATVPALLVGTTVAYVIAPRVTTVVAAGLAIVVDFVVLAHDYGLATAVQVLVVASLLTFVAGLVRGLIR